MSSSLTVRHSGSRFPSSWSSEAVQALFQSNATTPNSNAPPNSSSPTSTSSPAPTKHSYKKVIIAGILGGIAVVSLIVLAVLIFRHRAKRVANKALKNVRRSVSGMDTTIMQASTDSRNFQGHSEMSVTEQRSELCENRSCLEMAANEQPVELAIHRG